MYHKHVIITDTYSTSIELQYNMLDQLIVYAGNLACQCQLNCMWHLAFNAHTTSIY